MNNLKSLMAKDPWLAHIPLPRVIEILNRNVVASNLSEQQLIRIIPLFCLTSAEYSNGCLELLRQLSSESSVWDRLVEILEEEKMFSNHLVKEIYIQRPSSLTKHILESLDYLSDLSNQQLKHLLECKSEGTSKNKLLADFLSHKCSNLGGGTLQIKYHFLPSIISSCNDLINTFFSICNVFLDNCNYAVTSIKVVNMFYSLMKPKIDLDFELMLEYDFNGLHLILSNPPCIKCNKFVSSCKDLDVIVQNIKTNLINSCDKDLGIIRTLLSMNCEWLIFMKDCPEVRSLFIHIADFPFHIFRTLSPTELCLL